MNKYAKRIVILLLLTLIGAVLFACGNDNGQEQEPEFYVITYQAGEGGSIQGEANQQLKKFGLGKGVKAVADDGYMFIEWSDGNTNDARVDVAVSAEATYTAMFAETVTVTYSATEGGSITGNKSQTFQLGKDAATVTAVPDTGYEFIKWSDTESDNLIRTDLNVTEDINATAIFEKKKFSVNYNTDGNGYIDGTATQTITYKENSTSVTAVANEGYRFLKWSDNDSTNPARTDWEVTTNISVTAIFEKTHTVTYIAGIGGYILSGEQNQTVNHGENSTEVVVMMNAGYMFTGWSDGYGFHERTDSNVTEDITVTANFEFLFGGGDGTEESPLLIDNYEQLLMINLFPDSHYKLNTDLDLQGINHLPMFHISYMFEGSFDGGSHTISNLTVNRYLALPSLFGSIGENGEVKNLNITAFSIIVPNYNTILVIDKKEVFVPLCVGAVAGVSYGKLSNINVNGEIMASRLDYYGVNIGGVVGKMDNTIENCHAEINIVLEKVCDGKDYGIQAGGLIGITASSVISCSSSGSIKINYSEERYGGNFGGLIGLFYNAEIQSEVNITDCNSAVAISSSNDSICGGLIGRGYYCYIFNITNCYSIGDIFITVSGNAGGFLGYYSAIGGSISNCYSTGNVQTNGYSGGFAYQIEGNNDSLVEVKYCYASGNVKGKQYTAGFITMTGETNIYRSYTTSNVHGGLVTAGFIVVTSGSGLIKECFATGDLINTGVETENPDVASIYITGFIFAAAFELKDCYSKCDIKINNIKPIRRIVAVGFNYSGAVMTNCYYSGKITGTSISPILAGGITYYYRLHAQITNCHWIKYADSLATEATITDYGNTAGDVTDHEDISEMYNLANILNNTASEPVWVDIDGDTPQLKFMTD